MAERIDLLIIDPQVDFCDPSGSLYVDGAKNDIKRISNFINKFGDNINNIRVTMDCHHLFDIAHGCFWRNSKGENPDPFTIITNKDIVEGIWFPIFMSLPGNTNAREYVKEYTRKLEESGRYPLCIWPNHCLIASNGNRVSPELFESLLKWEMKNFNNVDYVSKGSSIKTEHYSAIKSEIPDSRDATTQINTRLINVLQESDKIIICGEAKSHCLKSTVEDIADEFQDKSLIKKIVLLEDASSPVTSFESVSDKFVEDMKIRGMQTALTTDF